jgi:hypothetical protein
MKTNTTTITDLGLADAIRNASSISTPFLEWGTLLPPWQLYDGTMGGGALRWSPYGGFATPPEVGTRLRLDCNHKSPGTVIGYFSEYGFLGICVQLDTPWHNGRESVHVSFVFGTEIAPLDDD